MEHKLFSPEFKISDDGAGSIEGYASTFLNWDSVNERPAKGAFTPHLQDFLTNGFISVGHDWQSLPVATPTDAFEDDHGLFVRAAFHSTPNAQAARTVVTERLARGKAVKLSIGYEVLADEFVQEGRILKDIKLYEWSVVTVPANMLASVTGAKADQLVGLPLDDHSSQALAANRSVVSRFREIVDMLAKEGRPLSEARRARLAGYRDALAGLMSDIDEMLASTEPKPKDDGKAAAVDPALFQEYLAYLRMQAIELGVPVP
jgi:HK97 family phage prohead protease